MKYCRQCVQPNTRPGVVFDENQVCQACVVAENRKLHVDWFEREQELNDIVFWAKSKQKRYDVVVGVSGGKDTTFQALYAKKQLGLNCLLVNCVPDNISDVGRANIENLVQHGFDMIQVRPNPKAERELSRKCFFEYGNFVKPLEYPLYACAFEVALNYDIPLVIEGENPGETLGVEYYSIDGDAMQWKEGSTVNGGNALAAFGHWVPECDLNLYQFPSALKLEAAGIRAIFLGYYVKEWSNHNNTQFAIKRGLQGRPDANPMDEGRTNRYFSIDSDLKIVNQNILKYYKFGYGAVTDEVCYDIRQGLITRDEGIRLVGLYDGKCSHKYVQRFCDYLDITLAEFWATVDKFVNTSLFIKARGIWGYIPKFTVGEDFEEYKDVGGM